MKKGIVLSVAFLFAVVMIMGAAPTTAQAKVQFVTIGTGGVTGVYYPTGGAICRLANKMKKETGIRCSVESTGGSVYNVNTIKAGELDFGIAQSDTVYQAFNGEGKFKGKAIKELRSVMAIYPELLEYLEKELAELKRMDPTALKERLDAMAQKGLVFRVVVGDTVRYSPNDIVFVEYRATGWPGRTDERNRAIAPLANRYYYHGAWDPFEHLSPKYGRTLPIQGTIEAGLVHNVSNWQEGPDTICNCCPCCCVFLEAYHKLKHTQGMAPSNYRVRVHGDTCIGCGVCVYKCPTKSLVLERREVLDPPPKDLIEYAQIALPKLAAAKEVH